MNNLYPLRFAPLFKERIWGGTKLSSQFDFNIDKQKKYGEAWILSGVPQEQSVVANGFLSGNELNELVEIYMGDLVGEKVYDRFGDQFPVLLKILDTTDILSLQVHPDDSYAKKKYGSNGKFEMWYILDADKDAFLIKGFSKPITKELFKNHLEDKTFKDVLQYEHTAKGDVYVIPPGEIHALGNGNLLIEIQQTSDITFRMHDWDRVDDKGNARELHIEESLAVIDFARKNERKLDYNLSLNNEVQLVKSPYFSVNINEIDQEKECDYSLYDSFVILICIEGEMEVVFQNGMEHLKKGETLLIPAIMDNVLLKPQRATKYMEIFID